MIIVGDNHFCDGGEDLGGGECVGKKLLDMELGHHRYLMTPLGILSPLEYNGNPTSK